MGKRSKAGPSRDTLQRTAAAIILLILAGLILGTIFGRLAIDTGRTGGAPQQPGSFSELSANPDALPDNASTGPDCVHCPDSYAATARLRAARARNATDQMTATDIAETDGFTPAITNPPSEVAPPSPSEPSTASASSEQPRGPGT